MILFHVRALKRAHAGAILLGVALAAVAVTRMVSAQPAFVPLPAGASIKIASPATGATVKSPVTFTFQVTGVTVKPAGTLDAGTGHHHLLIDQGPMEAGMTIPADATHLHYGKGQTEATIALTPGEHTVTLQFADGLHRSYGAAGANTIKIVVATAY
jgi:hypothetical protein